MASDTARAVGAGAGGGGGGASAGSSSSADSYIGSLISLTSKSEIRYEGVLYNINTDESSIGLRQVRSFGTEGRKKDGPQIPASDKVYEYILFRGSDIKDLQVKSSPPVQPTSIHHDPAIIQSQYVHPPSTTSNLQSAGSGNVPETSSHTTQLGLPRSPFQGSLPLYQPGGGLGSWGSAPNPPTANGSGLAMPPMYWQGYYAPSTGLPHLQQPALMRPPPGLPLPHSMQQPLQYPGLNMSLPPGSQTLPDFSPPLFAAGSSTPGLTSTSLPNTPGLTLTSLPNAPGLTSTSLPNAPGLTSGSLSVTPGLASSSVPATQAPTSSLLPSTPGLASSSLSVTLPLSSASTLAHDTSSGLLLNKSTITTVPATVGTALSSVAPLISNLESITTIPPSVPSILSSKSNTVTVPNMAYQSARQPVQPIVGSSFASQVETSAVPLATSGQLLQTAPSTLPSSQSLQTSHMHVDNKTTEAKIKPLLPDPITPPVAEAKEPILPLPKPITQKNGAPPHNHYNNRVHGRGRGNGFSRPVTKFTEEFDFTAMNEKFNKDEVWGYLGKGKDHLKDGELQEDEADEVFEEVEEEALKLEAKRNERAMESAGGQIIEASDGSNPNPISGEEKKPSPEVEVRLFRRGQGPIDVFQSKLGGWDQDRLEVQDILDKYGLKSLYAFDPSSGRSVPIRFNPRNGRSILPYHAGSTVVVDGEPKDSLVKPVTRIIVGVVAITILIVVLFKEPPEWFKSSRFSVGTFPPWILACMVIVFTRLRKRTKDVFKKYGW